MRYGIIVYELLNVNYTFDTDLSISFKEIEAVINSIKTKLDGKNAYFKAVNIVNTE